MYNILSLTLGLAAWGLGIAAICKKGCPWCLLFSLMACGASLAGQLLEIRRLVGINDWTALMDTLDAVVFAAGVLLMVTAVLNLAAVLRGQRHRKNTI